MSLFRCAGIFLDNAAAFYFRRQPGVLPVLHLDVTERCNLRCRICNLWKKPDALSRDELTVSEIKEIVRDLKGLRGAVVSLGGGEPLVRPDIFEIIDAISSFGISAHMDTNGVLLDEQAAKRLKKGGLKVLSVSLDSHVPSLHNEIRGVACFEDVVRGIRLIKERAPGIKIIVNCVINKKNLEELTHVHALCSALKVDGLKLAPFMAAAKQHDLAVEAIKDLAFSESDSQRINKKMNELIALDPGHRILMNSFAYLRGIGSVYSRRRASHKCFAGITTCVIMPYGQMAPCYNFHNMGMNAGNVRKNRLVELWSSKRVKELRKCSKACERNCWDLCTKEPSLRFEAGSLLRDYRLLMKELRAFGLR